MKLSVPNSSKLNRYGGNIKTHHLLETVMTRHYTGIGARNTPDDVLKDMTEIASGLESYDFTLRSGGAQGADSAFEAGVQNDLNKEIYLPWQNFNDSNSPYCSIHPEAYEMAKHYHPAWDRCSPAARKFHARNCYQILGFNLNTPSDFVICWTPGGAITGGTGQALRIAIDRDIPIFNMGAPSWDETFNLYMTNTLMGELQ